MIKIDTNLSANQKVSSHLAFLFLIVLSFAVALFTVSKGNEVVANFKNSENLSPEKRMQEELNKFNKKEVIEVKSP